MKKIASAVLFLAVLTCAAAPAAESTTHFTIYTQKTRKAGEQTVRHEPGGVTKVHYAYKDNGRGPELDEEFHLDKDGVPDRYSVKGASTFGAVVDEKFSRTGGQADWRSTSDQGSQTVKGAALYIPIYSSFEFSSVSITALAKQKSNKLPLLPSGTLSQRKLTETSVKSASGKTLRVQLLAQFGLGFSPNFYWATTGPGLPKLFASVDPATLTVIGDGWESNIDKLVDLQKAAEAKLLAETAAQYQHPIKGLLVIKNAKVFDSEKAQLTGPSDVYVLRGKITAVLPAGSPVQGADGVLDVGGRVLLPGLFDLHTHNSRWDGGMHLAAGVTTVRDMGNNNEQLQLMIDEVAAGKLLAPQFVPAGFLEGESPYSANTGFVIKDLDGAKRAVDWYNEHGYPQLKIYNSFPHDLVRETVAYAHSRGMRVSGHVPAFMKAQDVVEQGFDEIQHINQVMLNFLVTPTTDTRTLDRFILPAEKLAALDLDSEPVRKFVDFLRKHGTVIDPTLGAFEMIAQKDGELSAAFASVADHMPPDVKRGFSVGFMKIPDEITARRYKKSYAKMIEFVGRMYKAGIPIVAGTDSYAGFALQSELELYVKAGLTPAQALQVATVNGAKYTRTESQRGSIKAGKLADLVLVDGDPTVTIGDIRKVLLVITRGNLIYPREVDQAMGVAPFVTAGAEEFTPVAVTAPVARAGMAAPASAKEESN